MRVLLTLEYLQLLLVINIRDSLYQETSLLIVYNYPDNDCVVKTANVLMQGLVSMHWP